MAGLSLYHGRVRCWTHCQRRFLLVDDDDDDNEDDDDDDDDDAARTDWRLA